MKVVVPMDLKKGDKVYSSTGVFLGTVSRIDSTIFYAVDELGNEGGYCTRFDTKLLIEE